MEGNNSKEEIEGITLINRKERISNSESMKARREDEVYKEKERLSNLRNMRTKRIEETYKEKEFRKEREWKETIAKKK